jgi:hypothetical protein
MALILMEIFLVISLVHHHTHSLPFSLVFSLTIPSHSTHHPFIVLPIFFTATSPLSTATSTSRPSIRSPFRQCSVFRILLQYRCPLFPLSQHRAPLLPVQHHYSPPSLLLHHLPTLLPHQSAAPPLQRLSHHPPRLQRLHLHPHRDNTAIG